MKFMIIGPEGTPYSDGCFEFDMLLPTDYPNSPPHVDLQTTGGGTFRFNPNLYADGKVCLSLLGTWNSPHANEKWTEKSTLLQLFVSIQSLIFVDEPFFNEPGHEKHYGNPSVMLQSKAYNNPIKYNTVVLAMIQQIRKVTSKSTEFNPFRSVIVRHFIMKRDTILAQCKKWITEAIGTEYAAKQQSAYDILAAELVTLESMFA